MPALLRHYWSYRDELSKEDGILFRAHHIVIPVSLQKDVLVKLHGVRQGNVNTKLRARTSVFGEI